MIHLGWKRNAISIFRYSFEEKFAIETGTLGQKDGSDLLPPPPKKIGSPKKQYKVEPWRASDGSQSTFTPEQIIFDLRAVEALVGQSESIGILMLGQNCCGVTEVGKATLSAINP